MSKYIIIIAICVVVGAIGALLYNKHSSKKNTSNFFTKLTYKTPTITPTPTPEIPETLSIPAIGVSASIEDVGLDSLKRMGVPNIPSDVAWYDLGPRPGEKGNAVIDGHLDTVTGAPAVFWNLMKLTSGDKIIVIEPSGKQYTYDVSYVTQFNVDTFPINRIFGSTNNYMLNLITCGGTWNHTRQLYLQRTVVFAKLQQ